jgi:hypothetical protein
MKFWGEGEGGGGTLNLLEREKFWSLDFQKILFLKKISIFNEKSGNFVCCLK